MLDGLAMLLKLAIGADRFLRGLFGLRGRVLQPLDLFVELFEILRAVVETGQAGGDVVELRGHAGRLVGDLFELLAERRQFGRPSGERRQHRAEGAALFARAGNQHLEIGRLLFDDLVLAAASQCLERVQHDDLRW